MRLSFSNCFRLFSLLGVSFAFAAAQPALPSAPVAKESLKLYVARNGAEVLLSWELPADQIRLVEIYRNVHADVKGRNRCATVRPAPSSAIDLAPNVGTPYWYWLKVIFKDGQTMNVGPAMTPSAQVWTP